MRRFSNFRLGTRSFYRRKHRGSSRDYNLLSRVFAKTPIFEGHDYFSEATSEITLRVHVLIVCLICMHLVLRLGFSKIDFIFPYTP